MKNIYIQVSSKKRSPKVYPRSKRKPQQKVARYCNENKLKRPLHNETLPQEPAAAGCTYPGDRDIHNDETPKKRTKTVGRTNRQTIHVKKEARTPPSDNDE